MTKKELFSHQIMDFASKLGFDLIGFSSVKIDEKSYKYFKDWLDKRAYADMSYMSEKERVAKRKSAESLMKNAESVISLGINYYHEQAPLKRGHGRVARYAFGRDYHKVLKGKLKKLEEFLQSNFDDQFLRDSAFSGSSSNVSSDKQGRSRIETLSYVDTGPLLERSFAVQAGLGFIGKNSCLITKEFGSWVLLCEVITNLKIHEIQYDLPRASFSQTCKKNYPGLACGSCTNCIDSCPTHAITKKEDGEYFIDANKCLSYWTIEYKGPASKIPKQIRTAMKQTNRFYGCDICQEVCPHNCRSKKSQHDEFINNPIAGDSQNLQQILAIKSEKEFLGKFAGSPVMRPKLKGLKRTAKILLQASTDKKLTPAKPRKK